MPEKSGSNYKGKSQGKVASVTEPNNGLTPSCGMWDLVP